MNRMVALGTVALLGFLCIEGHCGGEQAFYADAIVARAALDALERGSIESVLVWVRPEDEEEVRVAFERAEEVGALSGEARILAERFFVDTVLQLHHAGDGTPYTGIVRGDPRFSTGVTLAADAIETGAADRFGEKIADYAANGVRQRYNELMEKRKYRHESIAAGREYSRAYLAFLRYIDRVVGALDGR